MRYPSATASPAVIQMPTLSFATIKRPTKFATHVAIRACALGAACLLAATPLFAQRPTMIQQASLVQPPQPMPEPISPPGTLAPPPLRADDSTAPGVGRIPLTLPVTPEPPPEATVFT